MSTLTAKAFIGEITKRGDGDSLKFFVNVSIPYGKDDNKKYQYCSCFVNKRLNRLFSSALESQTTEPDNKVHNPLSAQIADVEIAEYFFSMDENGGKSYLNGSGILNNINFG
ncbi:MAG: hypothetical protein QM500_04500 [Methylococcales bacterium]